MNSGMETNNANLGYYNNDPSYYPCGCNYCNLYPSNYYSSSNLPPINSFLWPPHYGSNVLPNTNMTVPPLPPTNAPTSTTTTHIPTSYDPSISSNTSFRNVPSSALSAAADKQFRDDSSSKNYYYDFHDEHEVSTTYHSFTGPKKSHKQRPSKISTTRECSNCKTQNTPLWRKHSASKDLFVCNACGLHYRKYEEERPLSRCKQGPYQERKRNKRLPYAETSV